MTTSAHVFARIGAGWAGSFVMTRAFARALPGEPAVAIVADVLNRLDLVATGELDLTWAFPMARVRWAYEGHRPWPDSPWSGAGLSNIRLVARIPRADHEFVAFAPWSPVQTLADVAQHPQVRIALRTDQLYEYENAIFHHYGTSLAEIERSGGRTWHIATGAHDLDREIEDRSVDVVIGHAATTPPWKSVADAGFRFAPLEPTLVEALERVGFERKVVPPAAHPWIAEPYLTLDLSDQPIVTRAEVPDDVIYEIAKSIDLNKQAMAEGGRGQTEEISRQWETRLVPLHRGAERYYREAGYIP
ncbi:MAG TPA: TAXI family TRAP transporter solute-binding subunit [Chloroflexota bacterium]|nr:TAXI family TRAP transporter solute-binding subunit [Chloroflexota bacterium]